MNKSVLNQLEKFGLNPKHWAISKTANKDIICFNHKFNTDFNLVGQFKILKLKGQEYFHLQQLKLDLVL